LPVSVARLPVPQKMICVKYIAYPFTASNSEFQSKIFGKCLEHLSTGIKHAQVFDYMKTSAFNS